MEHVNIPLGEVHTPHNWQWADATARVAEVVTDVALIDRVGLQVSDGTLWRLVEVVPAAVWQPVAQVVPWAGVTGKPETFAPSAHGHAVADVTGLQAELDGKQPSGPYIVEGDARLSDARPASDVYAWAKTASKPGYTATEVGATPAEHVGATGTAHGAATTSVAGFMSAADKTKLDGVATGANAYTHPASHPASIITQDASNRFVTDAEKTAWNAKEAGGTATAAMTAHTGDADPHTQYLPKAGGTMTGAVTFAAGQTWPTFNQSTTGNAGTATKLATARTINGVSFDGSANITINAVDSTAREAAITAGTTSQYWRGDKTWRDFFADVRAATLTGLSTATNAVVSATDTVLGALGKLQKQVSDNLTTLTSHTGSTSNPHGVTKTQVGLGNVDNTSDAAKPVSTATQTALNLKANSVTTVEESDIGTGPDEVPLNGFLGDMAFQSRKALVIEPAASANPHQVGNMVFELTSDTSLKVKVKGSDGVVRTATLTLS